MGSFNYGAETQTLAGESRMLTLNIIGAGAVGQTWGYLLVKHRVAKIQAIFNQSQESSKNAIEFIGQGYAVSSVSDFPAADLFLITVPDQKIAVLADELAVNAQVQAGTIMLHCSGALTSACLSTLRARGCVVASLHPSFSFKNPQSAINQFVNIPCALEGDAAAMTTITNLFNAIGGQVYQIAIEKKALYHAAAVFGSNYVITLLQQARDCFLDAGLPEQQAKDVLDALLSSVVENVTQASEPKLALTGPIQRADVMTIHHHLQALTDPLAREFYLFMAQKTLSISVLDESDINRIEAAFTSPDSWWI